MNYGQMSDWQINYAVAEALGSAGRCDMHGWVLHKNKRFDPCNSPADAWPIIVTNGISLSAWQNGKDWTAWFAGNSMEHCAPEFSHASDNPLRAAMIVYLMMQESA